MAHDDTAKQCEQRQWESARVREYEWKKEVIQICYTVCWVCVWSHCDCGLRAHNCADSCCERPFQLAHQKDKMKKKKKEHLVWQKNWHRYRWSFFRFFSLESLLMIWYDADNAINTQICVSFHGMLEFWKETEKKWCQTILKDVKLG